MAALTIAALLSRPFFGMLMDIKGRKQIFLIGLVIMIAASLLANFVTTVIFLIVLSMARGLSISATSTAASTMVADGLPKMRLSEGIGYYSISTTFASALAPMFAMFFAQKSDYFGYFVICSALAAIAMMIGLPLKEVKQVDATVAKQKKTDASKGGLLEKNAVRPAVINLFIMMTFSGTTAFLPSYALTLGIESIGLFYLVNSASILVTRLFAGKWGDRFGVAKVTYPSLVLMLVGYIILGYSHSFSWFLVAAVLLGLGTGTVQPAMQAHALKSCSSEKRGAANATFFTSSDVGIGIGSILWGFLSQGFGYAIVFTGSAGLIAFNMIAFRWLIDRRKAPGDRNTGEEKARTSP